MSFGQAISYCFSNYANFNGRGTRSEFWWFYLFVIIVNFGVLILFGAALGFDSAASTGISVLVSLAFLIPLYAAGARRMHDTGRSGWMQLLVLIPCVGPIIVIVFWAQPSQVGDNAYGPQPA